MSIKISLYKLRELRFDVEISPSNYCRNINCVYCVMMWRSPHWIIVKI